MKEFNKQISLFCNTPELNNNNEIHHILFEQFYSDGFLISAMQVNDVALLKNEIQMFPKIINITRPQLINKSTNEIINILPDRIDYIINSVISEEKQGIYTFKNIEQNVCQRSKEFLCKVIKIVNKKAYRIAVNTQYLFEDNFIESYRKSDESFEMSNIVDYSDRISKLSCIDDEKINVIREVNKNDESAIIVNNMPLPTNGVLVHFDINTYQKNTIERFGEEEVTEWIDKLFEIENSELKNLKK